MHACTKAVFQISSSCDSDTQQALPRESLHHELSNNLLMAHLLTEYLVTNWEGVLTEQGEPLPYSQVEARKVFLNKEYWLSLNLILINAANTFENYLYEQSGEDIEALKKP